MLGWCRRQAVRSSRNRGLAKPEYAGAFQTLPGQRTRAYPVLRTDDQVMTTICQNAAANNSPVHLCASFSYAIERFSSPNKNLAVADCRGGDRLIVELVLDHFVEPGRCRNDGRQA